MKNETPCLYQKRVSHIEEMLCRMSAMRHVYIAPMDHRFAESIGMNPTALYIYYFTTEARNTAPKWHCFVQVDERDNSVLWQKSFQTQETILLLDAPQVQRNGTTENFDDLRC